MEIGDWWPNTPEVVRRQLVNHPRDPVAQYCMDEVETAGGPSIDWWTPSTDWPGRVVLPYEAHMWILAQPETELLREAPKRDPRADYFARSWPRRG